MKKQTAIEWLEGQQKELVVQIKNGEFQIEDFEYYNAIYIEQAKEMEKQQIIGAHENGFMCPPVDYGLDYYNKTFNK